jgi:hypothetical protein
MIALSEPTEPLHPLECPFRRPPNMRAKRFNHGLTRSSASSAVSG